MKTNSILPFVVTLFVITSLSTCKVSQNNTPVVEELVVNSPQIIFLNYTIYKNAGQKNTIQFENKIITPGKLKAKPFQELVSKTGDLKCIQLDKNAITIDSLFISNPLTRTVEYVDDLGQFAKKEIEQDSAQFTIRMQLAPNTIKIIIDQLDIEGQSATNLISTKIK
jgi:hypothetical protein